MKALKASSRRGRVGLAVLGLLLTAACGGSSSAGNNLGSGPLLGTGSVVGQLTPWPGPAAPTPVTCANIGGTIGAAPIVDAGPNFVVASGLPEFLFATLIQDHSALVGPPPGVDPNTAPPVITWTQTAGPDAGLSF